MTAFPVISHAHLPGCFSCEFSAFRHYSLNATMCVAQYTHTKAEFSVLNHASDWTFGHFDSIGDGWVGNEFVAR